MTQLKDGKYCIVNRASAARVGVSPVDPGFDGWSVQKVSHEIEEHELRAVTWTVVHREGNLYELSVEDGTAIADHGHVRAQHVETKYLWKISFQEGNDAYTIEEVEGHAGWVLREDDIQVKLEPLPATKSIPPHYFSTDIWDFESV